jgi:hypothetical protein
LVFLIFTAFKAASVQPIAIFRAVNSKQFRFAELHGSHYTLIPEQRVKAARQGNSTYSPGLKNIKILKNFYHKVESRLRKSKKERKRGV